MSTIKYGFDKLASSFRRIFAHSSAFYPDQWHIHILINPGAGGFNFEGARQTLGGKLPRGVRLICESSEVALADRKQVHEPGDIHLQLHLSAYWGHAGETALALARQSVFQSGRTLIISLGGDGTHHEIMNSLSKTEDPTWLERVRLFRFPLGSGNDAADAWNPSEAWELLLGGAESSKAFEVQIKTRRELVHRAYNIASIGIDAHIGKVTNQLKHRLPGDFYKTVADLSVPFYPRLYRVSKAKISGTDSSGKEHSHEFLLGLLAMGVSGVRKYGHGLPILPAGENVCAIELRNLVTNIQMKKEIYRGTHSELEYVQMFRMSQFTVDYSSPIPMQLDGEVRMLEPEDFPLHVSIEKTAVNILSARPEIKS